MNSFSESYKAAGVDVTAGYKSVELMKQHVARTKIDGVVSGIGGFGGLFAPNVKDMEEPVLVSGTDGVGTKIKLAFLLDKHDTIGIDAVAMCVNDIICCGAKPYFSLIILLLAKTIQKKLQKSFLVLQKVVCSLVVLLLVVKLQSILVLCQLMNTMLLVSA